MTLSTLMIFRWILLLALAGGILGLVGVNPVEGSSTPLARRLLQTDRLVGTLPSWLELALSGGEVTEPLVALMWSTGDLDGDGVEEEHFAGFIPPPEIIRATGKRMERVWDSRSQVWMTAKSLGTVKWKNIVLKLGSTVDPEFLDRTLSSFESGTLQPPPEPGTPENQPPPDPGFTSAADEERSIPENSRVPIPPPLKHGIEIQSFSWGVCNAGKVVEGPNGEGCTGRWPPRKKSLRLVYLSDGSTDEQGQLSFPAIQIDNAVVTAVTYPPLRSSSGGVDQDCDITVTVTDEMTGSFHRRQYQPLTIRKQVDAAVARGLPARKHKAWLCSNFRLSFDVNEEPTATSIYHPCPVCPPPFFPEVMMKKGLNAVNVRQAWKSVSGLESETEVVTRVVDEAPQDDFTDATNPYGVVVDGEWTVPFHRQSSFDFFMKMEECAAGPHGDPHELPASNRLTCRDAATGQRSGQRMHSPYRAPDAGSGMASGRRQHAMIVLPSNHQGGVSLYLHLEVQLNHVARKLSSLPPHTGIDMDAKTMALDDWQGEASFTIVGALASTKPPLQTTAPVTSEPTETK